MLGDGTVVSAGDPVITRHNDRLLAISRTDWVKNGDRWRVTQVHKDGALTVRHDTLHTTIRLPADYVAEHVQLGYATTVHGAQGITTGTCHVVLTGTEDRNLLYVALSRGRHANHLYLAAGSDGDPHNLIRPETLIPPTALDTLAAMLRRDGSPVSATTALRDTIDPARLLHDAAARYHDALTTGAEQLIGSAGMERIDRHADAIVDGLTDAPAWPTLRSHLALLALEGHNPLTLLTAAVHTGRLDDARDAAAVLDARIDHYLTEAGATSSGTAGGQGPLPWLPGIPTRLAEDLDWGPYLAARHQQVLDHTDGGYRSRPGLDRGQRRGRAGLGPAIPRTRHRSSCVASSRCGGPSTTPPTPTFGPPANALSAPPVTTKAPSTARCARRGRVTRSRSAAGTKRSPKPCAPIPGSPRCVSGSPGSNAPAYPSWTTWRRQQQTGHCRMSTRPPPCGGDWSPTSARPHSTATHTPPTCSPPPGGPS